VADIGADFEHKPNGPVKSMLKEVGGDGTIMLPELLEIVPKGPDT
jgi:hypothetical protein